MDDLHLAHYGILGMKWGIRRYQPYPSGKHGTFLGKSRDEDIRIKKGSTAYRVNAGKYLKSGSTYVSLLEDDNIEYVKSSQDQDAVTVNVTTKGGDERPYNLKLKLSNDVIAPSYNKTMEAFIRTVDKYPDPKKFAETIYTGKIEINDFLKQYGKVRSQDALDDAYVKFAGTFMRDTSARRIFFSDLQAQGYNAIVDDWDKRFDPGDRSKGFTNAPMILFDGSKTAKTIKSEPISQIDYDYFFMKAYASNKIEEYWKNSKFKELDDKWNKFYKRSENK